MSYLTVGFLWCVFAVSVVILRRGHDRSILMATLLVALSVTSNVDPLYLGIDALLGGRNVATLLGDLCLVFGTYFLARGIARAALPGLPRAERWSLVAAIGVACGCIGLFLLIQTGGSSTDFMASYGTQISAALYSLLQISYLGFSLIAAGYVMVRNFPSPTGVRGARISAGVVTAGCAAAVALTGSVYAMDLAHLNGNDEIMSLGQSVYGVANPLTIVLVSGGLAALRACGLASEIALNRQAGRMISRLAPLHERVAEHGELPLRGSNVDKLHRQLVEIRDGDLTGQKGSSSLSLDDLSTLRRASRLLGVPD